MKKYKYEYFDERNRFFNKLMKVGAFLSILASLHLDFIVGDHVMASFFLIYFGLFLIGAKMFKIEDSMIGVS